MRADAPALKAWLAMHGKAAGGVTGAECARRVQELQAMSTHVQVHTPSHTPSHTPALTHPLTSPPSGRNDGQRKRAGHLHG